MMRTVKRWLAVPIACALLAAAAASCRRASTVTVVAPPRTRAPAVPALVTAGTADPSVVSLAAFGDWGEGTAEQREVAAGLTAYGQAFDAGLLLGDNFYVPLSGVDDPQWKTLFEELYQPPSLRFYAVPGNHDYATASPGGGTNMDVELAYAAAHPGGRFNLPGWWYRIDLPAADPWVTILMLDSNRGKPGPNDAEWQQERQWLEAQLADVRPTPGDRTRRKWVICCAHHPIYTNGEVHYHDQTLIDDWLPLLNAHGVDFYLAGHTHAMEHVGRPRRVVPSLIVSGGGGAQLHGQSYRTPGEFFKAHGFVHLNLTPDRAEAVYVDKAGRPLYSFTRDAQGREQAGLTTQPATATAPAAP